MNNKAMKNSNMKNRSEQLHVLAGLITWLVVFSISVMQLNNRDVLLEAIALQLVILATFCMVVNARLKAEKYYWAVACLLLMLALIFALAWRVRVDFFFIYSVIWISIAVNYFSYRTCCLWLLAISVAWYLTRLSVWGDPYPFFETLLVATFHVFALMSSMAAVRSKLANEQTQLLNRELLATQHLLAQASKESERTRIARDLHDLLGHHLTALTINLQVASRLSQGEVKEKVEQCHALSKLLLNDVRDAVTTLRDAPAVGLRELLLLAINDIPRLKVDLDVDQAVRVNDVKVAETVLRCVQEAITNSLRHSKAKKLSVQISEAQGSLAMSIRDDGQGTQNLQFGNGLKGMRERISAFKGQLHISHMAGFQIDVLIPLESS
jgi:two-component system sensor histidine kinase DesK